MSEDSDAKMNESGEAVVESTQACEMEASCGDMPTEDLALLKQELEIYKKKLQECEREKEQLKQRKVTFLEAIENEDMEKVTNQYKQQIQKLKEQLSKSGGSSDTKMTQLNEQYKQLETRYEILRTTSKGLEQKLRDTMEKLNAAESEIEKLKDLTVNAPEAVLAASQSHPGDDVGLEMAATNDVAGAPQNNTPTREQLVKFLQDYYNLVKKLGEEKNELNKQLQEAVKLNSRQAEALVLLNARLKSKSREQDQVQQSNAQPEKSPDKKSEAEAQNGTLQSLNQQLQKENKELERKLSDYEDHITEQEGKIEKLQLRCAEAEKNQSICAQQRAGHSVAEMECLQKLLDQRSNEIAELQNLVTIYKDQITEYQSEVSEPKISSNPDETAVFKQQLKAFQEDWIAENEEKQRIIEESKRLQAVNENLRLELQSRNTQPHSHQFSSPPPGPAPSFDMTNMSPQTMAPPFEYPPSHGQQSVHHVQSMPNVTGGGVYQGPYPHSYTRANTIPPRSNDQSQSHARYDMPPYAHGGVYYHPDYPMQGYNTGRNPEYGPTYGNGRYGVDHNNLNLRPRGPSPGQQNRNQSQPPKRHGPK